MLDNIWKNLALRYIDTFVLQFFHLAGYWKCSRKITTPIYTCTGLADAVLRNTW